MEGDELESRHLRDHSYSKPFDGEPMETTPPQTTDTSPFVSSLASDIDTLETVFISLLTLYSQYLGKSCTSPEQGQIDPEALDCLSNEQINFLVTSSSVNYIAIQQILAQKSKQVTPISQSNGKEDVIADFSLPKSTAVVVPSHPPPADDLKAPPSAPPPATTLMLTPQQLQELQVQVMALLRQQSPQLSQLSNEQQQLLISSVINQHLVSSSSGSSNQPVLVTAPVPLTASNHGALNLGTNVANITTVDQGELSPLQAKKKKESDAHKRPLTPFNIYFSDIYPLVQEEHPNLSFSEASKIVSSQWHRLGQEGKQKYYNKHEQLKLEFNTKQLHQKPDTPTQINSPIMPNFDPLTDVNNATTPTSQTKNSFQKPPQAKRPRKPSKENEETREKTEGMCIANGCYNMAIPNEERGPRYCSNECVINHCRSAYVYWVFQRKQRT